MVKFSSVYTVVGDIPAGSITAGLLATNAVTTAKINAKAVTAEKIGNVVRLASDTLAINGTVSSGLTWALLANTNYAFKAFIRLDGTAGIAINSGLTLQIHVLAAGAALVYTAFVGKQSNATVDSGWVTAVTTNIFTPLQNNTSVVEILAGVITVGANATTLQIDVVDNATGVTGGDAVKAGSFLEVSAVA